MKPASAHRWKHVLRTSTRIAAGIVLVAVFLPIGLAFIAQISGVSGDALAVLEMVGWFVFLPGGLLLVPVLLVVVVVEYAVGREYRGQPIVASWNVSINGECHVVSLPGTRAALPDHAWVDGARTPLRWTEVSSWSSQAPLADDRFIGMLSATYGKVETAATVLLAVVMPASAGGLGRFFELDVEGAAVESVPLADGERRG